MTLSKCDLVRNHVADGLMAYLQHLFSGAALQTEILLTTSAVIVKLSAQVVDIIN
jgi:hypothetical protein